MTQIHELVLSLEDVGNYLKLAALASQRMLAAMMVIPVFSRGTVPALPRHAFVVALTPFVVPLLPPDIFKSNPGALFFESGVAGGCPRRFYGNDPCRSADYS